MGPVFKPSTHTFILYICEAGIDRRLDNPIYHSNHAANRNEGIPLS
jgi:hypothetical protein